MQLRSVGVEQFHADGRTDGHDESNKSLVEIFRTRPKTNTLSNMIVLVTSYFSLAV